MGLSFAISLSDKRVTNDRMKWFKWSGEHIQVAVRLFCEAEIASRGNA
jgi:hypothetical protein